MSKGLFAIESNVQIYSSEVLRRINISTEADRGIDMAPTTRSPTAMLENRMLTGLYSSFLRLIAIITNKFNRMVTGNAIDLMTTEIQGTVVFLMFQVKCRCCGQKNPNPVFVERSMPSLVSVLLTSIL